MKFLHTSDLHIGIEVHEYSMIADQEHILDQILNIAKDEKVDGIIIAGDVYDVPTPRENAVRLLDSFLTSASAICPVYMIAGNHDSAERLSFGNRILQKQKLYISDTYSGKMEKITLNDEFGKLNIFMLPFIKPSIVRPFFPEEAVKTPDEAMMRTINASDMDPKERNILIAHQFVVGSGITLSTTESERSKPQVGGIDCISRTLLDPFDYVALGHIHRAQNVPEKRIRYSGSPIKYSASEALDEKSVTIVELKDKGNTEVRIVPLKPLRDMRRIKGTVEELIDPVLVAQNNREDYIFAVLTESTMNAKAKLSTVFPNIMEIVFEEEHRFESSTDGTDAEKVRDMSLSELFGEFYNSRNPEPLNDLQKRILAEVEEDAQEESP